MPIQAISTASRSATASMSTACCLGERLRERRCATTNADVRPVRKMLPSPSHLRKASFKSSHSTAHNGPRTSLADRWPEGARRSAWQGDLHVLVPVGRSLLLRSRTIRSFLPRSSGRVSRFEIAESRVSSFSGRSILPGVQSPHERDNRERRCRRCLRKRSATSFAPGARARLSLGARILAEKQQRW